MRFIECTVSPNVRTDRRGRPVVFELATGAAPPAFGPVILFGPVLVQFNIYVSLTIIKVTAVSDL